MQYHLVKRGRLYKGIPYCGVSSDNISMETDNLKEARDMKYLLTDKNFLEWDIYDTQERAIVSDYELLSDGIINGF